ncbi:hypothetical protein [Christiangramia sp. SM2212]|uniref:Lipoprotein n=1 Tax=Christiangramia sediminicola TaxID=3073267 RepID=A0ABU1EN97_9FLAO|nr:hypothetical protein [Christiangramia sp. SM2212]MDR5589821.1 hypothetical protein [Christiangramia sp. SM2212]
MKFFKFLLILSCTFYFTSCASSYQHINPEDLTYNSQKIEKEGVSLEYKYDLLPKKYAKKERKSDIRLVAFGIQNNTDRQLILGRDFKLAFENGGNALVLSREKTFQELKQQGAWHLLYLLLTPVNVQTYSDDGRFTSTTNYPIGLILGPGIAGYNMLRAGSANKRFKKDLETYDLTDKTINPGEEKFGLVGIRADGYDSLKINYIGNTDTLEENEDTDVK